jgi:hypothetical protein
MSWEDSVIEIDVPFDPKERELYEADDPLSLYYSQRLPDSVRQGRQRHGLFAEIVVRAAFRAAGFTVLISEPRMPDEEGFIVADYAGKRRNDDPAYTRMFKHFPRERLEDLQEKAKQAKITATESSAGGDPDLFAFSNSERFFVEVKDTDQLHANQLATFPLIEEILGCQVCVARLTPVAGAQPSDFKLGKGKEAECGATANRDFSFVLRRLETMLEPEDEDELGAESGTDEQDAAMSPPEAEEIGNRVESKLTQQVWTEAERGEAKLAGVKARVAAAFGQRHGEPADWASGAVRLFVAQLEPSKAQADTQAIELEADQAEEATDRRKRATEKARAIAALEAAQALEDTLSQARGKVAKWP